MATIQNAPRLSTVRGASRIEPPATAWGEDASLQPVPSKQEPRGPTPPRSVTSSPGSSAPRRRSNALSPQRLTPNYPSRPPSTMMKGVLVMLTVIRHVLLSVSVVWLANFCSSVGNFPSGLSAAQQSYSSFVLSVMLWNHFFFSAFILIIQSMLLVNQTFLSHPGHKATLGFCCRRLICATWPHYVVTVAMVVITNQFISKEATDLHPDVAEYRLEFHLGCCICLVYMTATVVATGRIFKNETEEGRARMLASRRRLSVPSIRSSARGFCRALVLCSPRTMIVITAGLYVQLSSSLRLASETDLFLFAFVSLVAKVSVQELAKAYMLRRNVKDIRSMYGIVALPTVLIDTQVRMVLQRLQNTQTTYSSIVIMAFVELILRVAKVSILKLGLYPEKRRLIARARQKATRTLADFQAHEQRLMRFFAAESYADMAAEYIAIGCSSSILFFYSHHPKYNMALSDAVDGDKVTIADKMARLGLQLGLELFVDFTSCVFEIRGGVDFQDLHRHAAFLGAVLVCIGVLNVQISAFMFLWHA